MYTKVVIINVVNVNFNVIVRLRLRFKVLDPGLGSSSEFSSLWTILVIGLNNHFVVKESLKPCVDFSLIFIVKLGFYCKIKVEILENNSLFNP